MAMEISCFKDESKGCCSFDESMMEAEVMDSREEASAVWTNNNDQRYEEAKPVYMEGKSALAVWKSFLDEAEQAKPKLDEFDFKGLIGVVENLPFIKENLKKEVKILQEGVKESSSLNIKMERLMMKVNARYEILSYLSETYFAVQRTHFQLVLFGTMNQADGSATYNRKRTHDGSSKICTAVPKHAQEAYDCHMKQLGGPCDPGHYLQPIFGEDKISLLESFAEGGNGQKIGDIGALTLQQQARISKLNNSLQNAFNQAKLIKKNIPDNYSTILSTLENNLIDEESKIECDIHLPGPLANEVNCVQPFLLTVFRSLGAVFEELNSDEETIKSPNHDKGRQTQTPGKPARDDKTLKSLSYEKERQILTPEKTVMVNRTLSGTDYRHRRVADTAIAANDNFIFLHFDDSIEVTAEVKPGEREGRGPRSLQDEGKNQVFRHLGEFIHFGFNLLGLGSDTYATGVYATVTHVKFYRLKLLNMGTPDTKLQVQETPNMPILSKENFDKYVIGGGAKKINQWKSYREEMYGNDEHFNMYWRRGTKKLENWKEYMKKMYGSDEESQTNNGLLSTPNVPSGLVALFNLMSTPRNDLFGSPIGCKSEKVEHLLGNGSFASVYSSPKENSVVKFSRFGAKEMLDNEAEILKLIKSDEDIGIVRLLEDEPISIHIGGITHQVPALTLAPRGVPASVQLLSLNDENEKRATLKEMGQRLLSALSFLHERNIYWNDGSVHNIMFDRSANKAFLIDFGMASSDRRCLKGFVGTPHFAHQDIFKKYPSETWEPKADYDNTALAFSMATLSSNRCCCPWKSFQPRTLTDEKDEFSTWADIRSQMAWSSLKTGGFKEGWRVLCFDGEKK